MQLWGILILVFLGIIVIALTIARKKLFFNRIVLFVAIIGIVLIFIGANFNNGNNPLGEMPDYQKKAPPISAAPYYLPTNTRTYYVATFKDTPEVLTLTNYYFYDKKNWENSDIPLPFDKSIPDFKDLRVIRRNPGG